MHPNQWLPASAHAAAAAATSPSPGAMNSAGPRFLFSGQGRVGPTEGGGMIVHGFSMVISPEKNREKALGCWFFQSKLKRKRMVVYQLNSCWRLTTFLNQEIPFLDVPQHSWQGNPRFHASKTPSFKRFRQTRERNHVPAHLGWLGWLGFLSFQVGGQPPIDLMSIFGTTWPILGTLTKEQFGYEIYLHHKNNELGLR